MNLSGNTHPTTSPELLPCPFCGCEKIMRLRTSGNYACTSCLAEGPPGCDTAAEWNRRVTRQPQSPSASERARDELVAQAQELNMGYGPPSTSLSDAEELLERAMHELEESDFSYQRSLAKEISEYLALKFKEHPND